MTAEEGLVNLYRAKLHTFSCVQVSSICLRGYHPDEDDWVSLNVLTLLARVLKHAGQRCNTIGWMSIGMESLRGSGTPIILHSCQVHI